MDIIWSSTISGMINVNACTIYLMHVSGSWESILEINPEWNIYVDLIVELVWIRWKWDSIFEFKCRIRDLNVKWLVDQLRYLDWFRGIFFGLMLLVIYCLFYIYVYI